MAGAFLLGKRVGGCTDATIRVYRAWVDEICSQVGNVSALDSAAIVRFFAGLRDRGLSPSSVHQAYRTLKTFCRWLQTTGALDRSPLAGVNVRTPATLPQVPTEDELRAILTSCPSTFEGHASLHTTLRYSSLVAADLQRAHKDASAIERIGVPAVRRPGPGRQAGR